ncbi:MAG: hypothetical protein ACYTE3_08170 [Planctomycetota bacterium]
MVESAERWLATKGLSVKREFPVPWGICDLVACSLNKRSVKTRLRVGQLRPIGSLLKVILLNKIPDERQDDCATTEELATTFAPFLSEARIEAELGYLLRGKFIVKTPQGAWQKVNGWMPLWNRLIAVELKLARIEEVLRQAQSNKEFADESYAGLPMETARRLVRSNRKANLVETGIGILGIAPDGCRVVLKSCSNKWSPNHNLQAYCAERFWKMQARDIVT